MKTEHSYSAKGVLAALGRSALYQLFFVAVQVLLPFVYGIGIAADAAINRRADLAQGAQAVAERLVDVVSALTLLSCVIIAAVLLLWFLLRKKPLSEAAGLRHCSGWTVGVCAFGAVGLYVLVSLVLAIVLASGGKGAVQSGASNVMNSDYSYQVNTYNSNGFSSYAGHMFGGSYSPCRGTDRDIT